MKKQTCQHVWWSNKNDGGYTCEICGKVVKHKPSDLTFSDCKACSEYPCNIRPQLLGDYNSEYLKRKKLNRNFVFLISCPDKTKCRANPGGFVDIDGTRYRYAPNQQPHVDDIPVNVRGSGGAVVFKSKETCKCCNHSDIKHLQMWEPQFDEYVKTHPNTVITVQGGWGKLPARMQKKIDGVWRD